MEEFDIIMRVYVRYRLSDFNFDDGEFAVTSIFVFNCEKLQFSFSIQNQFFMTEFHIIWQVFVG